MEIDARMHDAAQVRSSADTVHCPRDCAGRARSRAALARPGRRASACAGGANALVALLLLLLMPVGLVHRSTTGACRSDHRAAVAASAGAVNDVGVDAPSAAAAEHPRTLGGHQHGHDGSALPLDGAAPGACGPAGLAERSAPTSDVPYRAALPVWRALSPLALAPPPPARPPRLS